uniref:Uncharacterized protein n=1 Tax=viral metagenome TaxID=1070528 RepID=A0A6C0K950_9ZZZZ
MEHEPKRPCRPSVAPRKYEPLEIPEDDSSTNSEFDGLSSSDSETPCGVLYAPSQRSDDEDSESESDYTESWRMQRTFVSLESLVAYAKGLENMMTDIDLCILFRGTNGKQCRYIHYGSTHELKSELENVKIRGQVERLELYMEK